MHYYYNENTGNIITTTNFEYNPIPAGYVEITKEQYDELIKNV